MYNDGNEKEIIEESKKSGGADQKDSVKGYLNTILTHINKYDISPEVASYTWMNTIKDAVNNIDKAKKDIAIKRFKEEISLNPGGYNDRAIKSLYLEMQNNKSRKITMKDVQDNFNITITDIIAPNTKAYEDEIVNKQFINHYIQNFKPSNFIGLGQ